MIQWFFFRLLSVAQLSACWRPERPGSQPELALLAGSMPQSERRRQGVRSLHPVGQIALGRLRSGEDAAGNAQRRVERIRVATPILPDQSGRYIGFDNRPTGSLAVKNATRPLPTGTPGLAYTNSLCSYPLAERDSYRASAAAPLPWRSALLAHRTIACRPAIDQCCVLRAA